MNCEDITNLLDNADLQQLDDRTRADVSAHVSSCPDCGRQWTQFGQFVSLPDMTVTPALLARFRDAVAAGERRRERPLAVRAAWVGSVFVLVAAAAVSITWVSRSPQPVQPDLPAGVEAVMLPTPPAASVAYAPRDEAPATPVPAPSVAPVTRDAVLAGTFTVRLQPLQTSVTEESSRVALADLQSALIAELRAIPGLVLAVTEGHRQSDRPVDYELTLQGDRAEANGSLRAQIRVRRAGPNAVVQPFAGAFTPDCVNGLDSAVGACMDARSLAASLVGTIRAIAFPTDVAVRQQLEAQLANPDLDSSSRLEALSQLHLARARPLDASSTDPSVRNPLSSAPVVKGAISLAEVGSAPQRAAVWRTMKGSGNAQLIDPLIAAARLDADRLVRQEAVITMAADFANDDRVRAALETAAREDASTLVRALARRTLVGEADWETYVVASLSNEQLTVEGRMEALFLHLNQPAPGARAGTAAEAHLAQMLGEKGAEALGRALPAALQSSIGNRIGVVVIGKLGAVNHPAITEALLAAVDMNRDWLERRNIIRELTRRSSEPRVRSALERIAATDPDADARKLAADALPTARSDTP